MSIAPEYGRKEKISLEKDLDITKCQWNMNPASSMFNSHSHNSKQC
jgi:hypothetical protein